MAHDIVIRGGRVTDGTGADPMVGDVAIDDGVITAVGKVDSKGADEIDAEGHIVSPGVPVDDVSCWIICFVYHPDRNLTDDERRGLAKGRGIFAAVDEHFVPVRNRDNDYLIDRDLQRHSSFTGITGISEQDAAIADSQGLIADRTREMLGQTDLGIVRFRQMVLAAATAVQRGQAPHGADAPAAYAVRSGDVMSGPDPDIENRLGERFGERAGRSLKSTAMPDRVPNLQGW